MRRGILLTTAFGAILALAACSSGSGGSGGGDAPAPADTNTTTDAAPADTPAAAEAVTLSVWAPAEDQVDSSSWLQTQQAAFAAAHPEYTITWNNSVVSEGDAGSTVEKDPTAAADVYMFANDQLGRLIQAHAVGVLPPAAIEQVKAQNSDVMLTSVTGPDGQLYGVPFTANTWFMYYNSSKFTADDIKNLDTMLAKSKVAFPVSNSWYLASFYVGNGATLFGPDGTDEAAGFDFGGQNAIDVTTYLAGLVANPNFVNDANGAGLAGLENGTIDAFFSGSWDASNVREALGDNYAAAQPPTYTIGGNNVQMRAFAGSKAIAFNPNASNPKAAAEFAAFLGSTDAQQAHYEMRGIIPTDSALASDAAVSADVVALAQMATIDNASVLQPTVAAMGNYWDPTTAFGEALVQKDVTAANAAEKTAAWNASVNG